MRKSCNSKKIEQINGALKKNVTLIYIEPHINFRQFFAIEYESLLEIAIIQAASSVIHQSDFFVKMLQILTFNSKLLSKKSQRFGSDYVLFQSYLEACLQSKNPVEAALFLKPQLKDFHHCFMHSWKEFIDDLKNCYDPQDLIAYEKISLAERKKAFSEQYRYETTSYL